MKRSAFVRARLSSARAKNPRFKLTPEVRRSWKTEYQEVQAARGLGEGLSRYAKKVRGEIKPEYMGHGQRPRCEACMMRLCACWMRHTRVVYVDDYDDAVA